MLIYLLSLFIEPKIEYVEPIAIEIPSDMFEESNSVACFCVSYARSIGVEIPIGTNAEDITGNTTPTVGGLALFKFNNGVSHVGVIQEMSEDGFRIDQANKIRCEINKEWISWDNEFLTGFWVNPIDTSIK